MKFYQGQPHRKLPDGKNWRFAIWLLLWIVQHFLGTKSKSSSLFQSKWSESLPHVSIFNHGINQSFFNNFFLVMMVKIIPKSMSQNFLIVQLMVLVGFKVKPSQLVVSHHLNAISKPKSWIWPQWPGLMRMIILMESKSIKK